MSKLGYIQNMGFDAIWISPVVANLEGDTGDGTSYHGYWTIDQTSLNAHFGTDGDLQLLGETLHQMGMYLMVDVVVNDMAAPLLTPASDSSAPPVVNYTAFTPFNNESSFHPFCWITDYSNQTNVEQCWLGDASVPLADVDTENPDIVAFFNGWIADLVKTYEIDGLRLDTVKHVRKDFWPAFAQSANVWSIGEVLDGDIGYVANYTGAWHVTTTPLLKPTPWQAISMRCSTTPTFTRSRAGSRTRRAICRSWHRRCASRSRRTGWGRS